MDLQKGDLKTLAGQVIRLSRSSDKRSEELWLRERYQDFLRRNGMRNRADGDKLLARRIRKDNGAGENVSSTEVLKIRYWRTGRHYPKNRAACEAFAKALELDEQERHYLITEWFNRSDQSFGPEDAASEEYLKRRQILSKLQQEFLSKQQPEELLAMCAPGTAPSENLRYIYCRNASRYLGRQAHQNMNEPISHLDTRGYEYQFSREMKLLGEISRNTMIRHLLVLGMPFVSRKRMNGWLADLGYMSLRETHRLPGGEAADLMILGLLEIYERECTGWEPLPCTEWFCQAAGLLDDALGEAGCAEVNPFRFKHIMGGRIV